VYTKTYLDNAFQEKANISNVYSKSQINQSIFTENLAVANAGIFTGTVEIKENLVLSSDSFSLSNTTIKTIASTPQTITFPNSSGIIQLKGSIGEFSGIKLNGTPISVTADQINQLTGVNRPVQEQIDEMQSKNVGIENANQILMSDSHGHITASTGLSNQVLTIDEYGKPFWNDIDTVNGNLFVDGMLTVQGSPSTFSHISSESIAVTSFISTNDLLVQGSIIFAKNSNPLSQTTLTSMNQTAPRSITLPDASGIVVLTTDSSGKITTNNIKDNAITSDQISNGSISTEDIADHSITPEKLSHSFSSIYTDTSLSQSHQGVLFISGNTIITLPDASENMGKQLTLKKVDSSENFIKVSGIVDGETNPKIRYQFDYMTILSDGSNWYKIAEHMTPDITPPLPGNEGIITFNNITANSVDISWEYGVDNETSQVDLEYLICVSLNMDDMLSVPSCEYQKHVDYTKNLQSKRIDNLSHQSMHYINVIVKDNSQNKSFYKEISVKTLPFFEVDNRNNLEGVRYTSIAIADYDNDQDLDILMAGSSISKNRILMLYNNDGTGVFSKVEDFSIPSISHYDIEWLDLNNNSYLDLIITGLDTHSNLMTYFYINQKNNEFSEINNNSIVFRAIDQGDYDNDGDMDIISLGGVNNESPILYNNNGGQFTKVSNVFNLNISYGEFEWADINNDGCLDLFFMYESMMMMEFNYKFFFQTKTAQFIENTSNTFLNRASEFFDFADYDNDSDLDLLVNIYDESWNSHLKLFPNNGSGVFSEADSITLTAINPSASSWGDFDNDGFSDLIIIGKSKNNNSSTFLYRNVGNGVFTELSDVELIGIHQGTVCFGDFDNDKDLDIIISGRTDDGQLETKIYTNNSKNNTIPSTPTDLTSNVFGSVTLSWSASSDSETISPGLSYHVLINKNAGEPSSISFDNGYRKIVKEGSTRKLELTTRLPYGTYFWTVQAIDTAYAGSPFAPEQSFSIVSPSPGDSGKITPVDITTNSVQLKWMTASNDTTPYSDLMYMVYVSTVDYGYQVNNWINDGEPINSWETNISTQKIENLTQDTEYFCTVLVKDADGDINIYNAVSVIPRLFTEQKDIVLTALMESSSIWADYDADQDLDIIIYGKTFEYEYTTTIYNNLGANNFAVLTNSSLAGLKYGDFSMADFDKDEDLDFINTGDNSSSTVTMLYKNNTTNFNVLNDVYIQGAKYSDIVWADLNNDGNLDLIVTGYLSSRKIATQIFQYIGNNQFIEIMDHNVMGVQNGAIEVADLNNDGLLDILIAGYSDSGRIIKIYQNHKGFTFNEVSASNFDPVYYCSIHCGDYNNDGFLDILLTGDNSSQSIMKIYQNTKNMEFVELSEINLSGIKEGNASWGDYDNDGYLDILLMGRDNNYKPITKIYKNNQNNTFEELNDIHFEAMYEGEISWGDYDNDNDIDILATGYNRVNDKYSSKVYRNNTKTINTRPSSPTELTSVINDGTSVTFEWNLGTDAETPEKGLSYNLCVGSGPDVCDIVSPMSARTGFQYIPARGSYQALSVTMDVPGGKYYWGVQSVDTSFVGSPLTLSNTFNTEVPSPGNSGYITIDFVHKDSVTLSWENAIDDATAYSMLSYKVCYSTNDYGQTVENWENNTSSSEWMTGITNHKITDLTSGTNYYFNVIVKDESNYKSTYLPTSAIPSLFTDMTSIELKGLASAAIEWGDYSNDGYLDLILLGMYQPGSQTYGAMFRNCKNDNFFLDRTAHSAQGATVNWVDCDNDGDLDLFYSGYDSSYNKISRLIIIDDNGGRVTSYSSKFIPVRVATSSWGDFDNDGDLDLIISGMGSGIQIALYENLGNLNFREVTDLGIIGTHSGSIEWGDFDNDADLDLILTGFNYDLDPERITKIYQNNGNKTFSEVLTNNFPGVENGSGTWGDYNNDGYLDILLTGTTYKNSNYTYITKIYKNLGNKTFTEVPGLNITGIAYGSAKWGDVDNDGDLDILIRGSIGSNYYVAIYENNGEDIFTQMSNTNLHQFSGCRNSAKWGDFDNNGSLDFIIAGSDGTATYQTKIYRNNAEILNTVPSAPQNLTVNFIDSKVIFSWTSSTDIETPSNGLSYNLRIGSEPGACDIVTPMALSTGFRIIAQRGPIQGLTAVYTIPSGIYYWTVQAVDTAFAGSPFAIEQTFTIP
jgi:predicted nucleotidyltransferase